MRSHLTNRVQHCKINNSFIAFIERVKVLAGIPQGFIFCPLHFNIFISDIFLFLRECDLANYADDSIMYTSNKSILNIINSLSHVFTVLPKWFLIEINAHLCY